MIKLVTLLKIRAGYTRKQVEEYYQEVHVKVAGAPMPYATKYTTATIHVGRTQKVPWWRISEHYFNNYDDLKKALASSEAQALEGDREFWDMVDDIRFITDEIEEPRRW